MTSHTENLLSSEMALPQTIWVNVIGDVTDQLHDSPSADDDPAERQLGPAQGHGVGPVGPVGAAADVPYVVRAIDRPPTARAGRRKLPDHEAGSQASGANRRAKTTLGESNK